MTISELQQELGAFVERTKKTAPNIFYFNQPPEGMDKLDISDEAAKELLELTKKYISENDCLHNISMDANLTIIGLRVAADCFLATNSYSPLTYTTLMTACWALYQHHPFFEEIKNIINEFKRQS